MKAGFLAGIGKIDIRDVPMPEIKKANEVLLKVASVGVCGSDIHYYKEGQIGSSIVEFPFRIGHEFSAIVEEVGKNVTRLKPGDRVAVDPAVFCYECDQCKAGRFNTCRTLTFMGSPKLADGCLAEYVTIPEQCCFPSEKLAMDQLCLVEPLSIGVYAAKYALPLEGKAVGILGSGPIGLSTLLACKAYGARAVYMTDKIDHRVSIAIQHGADWAGNPLKGDIVKEVTEREPFLLDAVFECAGEQDTLDQGLFLLKPGGQFVIVGIHTINRISFTADVLRRREISIHSVRRQNESTKDALDLIEQEKVNADFMATHHFSIDDSQKAFDTVANYKDGVIKAIINP
ncbi:MAG: alcohol dehydrogenase catalytic domain-containing protein [Spirochaetales bacterium]|nr:alcohol dehydrogenase catalytic domain-containing protein [Spirochaetales bacterium]